ncbi:MAG: hypothetical protein ACI9MC_000314 [Kiritimatiellia bacterium]|jgi:hypothetical protein
MQTATQAKSLATFALIAGIISVLLPPIGLLVPIVLVLTAAAGIAAIVMGAMELKNIKSGALPPDSKVLAIVGLSAGGLGCLAQLGMVAIAVILLLVMAINS